MPTSRRRLRRLTPADSSLAPEAMVQRCSHDYWGYLMKRILFLVIITVVAVGLLAAPALAGTTVCKVGLYAGQNTHVGYLLITHDTSAPSLTITYDLKAGYKLKEVHLAVAHDAAGIPVNPGRRGSARQVPAGALSVDQQHDLHDRLPRGRTGAAGDRRARRGREPVHVLQRDRVGHAGVQLLRRRDRGRLRLRAGLGEVDPDHAELIDLSTGDHETGGALA